MVFPKYPGAPAPNAPYAPALNAPTALAPACPDASLFDPSPDTLLALSQRQTEQYAQAMQLRLDGDWAPAQVKCSALLSKVQDLVSVGADIQALAGANYFGSYRDQAAYAIRSCDQARGTRTDETLLPALRDLLVGPQLLATAAQPHEVAPIMQQKLLAASNAAAQVLEFGSLTRALATQDRPAQLATPRMYPPIQHELTGVASLPNAPLSLERHALTAAPELRRPSGVQLLDRLELQPGAMFTNGRPDLENLPAAFRRFDWALTGLENVARALDFLPIYQQYSQQLPNTVQAGLQPLGLSSGAFLQQALPAFRAALEDTDQRVGETLYTLKYTTDRTRGTLAPELLDLEVARANRAAQRPAGPGNRTLEQVTTELSTLPRDAAGKIVDPRRAEVLMAEAVALTTGAAPVAQANTSVPELRAWATALASDAAILQRTLADPAQLALARGRSPRQRLSLLKDEADRCQLPAGALRTAKAKLQAKDPRGALTDLLVYESQILRRFDQTPGQGEGPAISTLAARGFGEFLARLDWAIHGLEQEVGPMPAAPPPAPGAVAQTEAALRTAQAQASTGLPPNLDALVTRFSRVALAASQPPAAGQATGAPTGAPPLPPRQSSRQRAAQTASNLGDSLGPVASRMFDRARNLFPGSKNPNAPR